MARPSVKDGDQNPTLLQRDSIQLDWKGYFIEFCKIHGEPVLYNNHLIFRDGWSYSSTDYEGPEFGPPIDTKELDALVLQYWTLRKQKLEGMILSLRHEKRMLEQAQSVHSAPLQKVTHIETSKGKRRGYESIDTRNLDLRIGWIVDDLKECNERLIEINDFYNKRTA